MFTNKQTHLLKVPAKKKGTVKRQPFLAAAAKKAARTLSGNYAPKFSTTGNDFLDQFANVGTYRKPRPFADISRDCVTLWSADPQTAVKLILYLRTVSRKVSLLDGSRTERVQKGQGLKYEAIMRMIWLAVEHPNTFWQNIGLLIALGSWKDIFQMLTYDLEFNGWNSRVLNWDKFADLFKAAATNETQVNLFKKYMPQIQAKSKCVTLRAQARTIIAKWLANTLGVDYKGYRLLKGSGNAHRWQQLISKRQYGEIDFKSIHGRALLQLTSSKFLENQKLTKVYDEWIEAQPVAKFTGYVHELAMKIGSPNMCGGRRASAYNKGNLKPYLKKTINKQYDGLVAKAREDETVQSGLLVVRDTSSSMTSNIPGQDFSAYDVGKALGIFFGDMLDGPFKSAWLEFSDRANIHFYKATSFVDKWMEDMSEAYGGTNFQAVGDFFIDMLRKGVDEADFPSGILCISDGEFNRHNMGSKTNVEALRVRFRQAGFSADYVRNFKIVLWDIRNNYYGGPRNASFETHENHDNVFYFGGYDGSVVSFLLGGSTSEKGTPKNAEELFEAAMDQEVLNMTQVVN